MRTTQPSKKCLHKKLILNPYTNAVRCKDCGEKWHNKRSIGK